MAPTVTAIWRITFTLAGVVGAAGVLLVVPVLRKASSRGAATFMLGVGLPLYLLVTPVAAVPGVHEVARLGTPPVGTPGAAGTPLRRTARPPDPPAVAIVGSAVDGPAPAARLRPPRHL